MKCKSIFDTIALIQEQPSLLQFNLSPLVYSSVPIATSLTQGCMILFFYTPRSFHCIPGTPFRQMALGRTCLHGSKERHPPRSIPHQTLPSLHFSTGPTITAYPWDRPNNKEIKKQTRERDDRHHKDTLTLHGSKIIVISIATIHSNNASLARSLTRWMLTYIHTYIHANIHTCMHTYIST
jgi:hypothetical protein